MKFKKEEPSLHQIILWTFVLGFAVGFFIGSL